MVAGADNPAAGDERVAAFAAIATAAAEAGAERLAAMAAVTTVATGPGDGNPGGGANLVPFAPEARAPPTDEEGHPDFSEAAAVTDDAPSPQQTLYPDEENLSSESSQQTPPDFIENQEPSEVSDITVPSADPPLAKKRWDDQDEKDNADTDDSDKEL